MSVASDETHSMDSHSDFLQQSSFSSAMQVIEQLCACAEEEKDLPVELFPPRVFQSISKGPVLTRRATPEDMQEFLKLGPSERPQFLQEPPCFSCKDVQHVGQRHFSAVSFSEEIETVSNESDLQQTAAHPICEMDGASEDDSSQTHFFNSSQFPSSSRDSQFDFFHPYDLDETFDSRMYAAAISDWERVDTLCEDLAIRAFFLKSNLEEVSLQNWWLLDSGASRSVVSEKFLPSYHVERERNLEPPLTFSTASGEKVSITREVLIRVDLKTDYGNTKPVLMRCLVSSVEHSLISLYGMSRQGWSFRITPEICEITFKDVRLSPIIWANCPWLQSAESGGDGMSGASRRSKSYPKDVPKVYRPESFQSNRAATNGDAIEISSVCETDVKADLPKVPKPRVFFKNGLIPA